METIYHHHKTAVLGAVLLIFCILSFFWSRNSIQFIPSTTYEIYQNAQPEYTKSSFAKSSYNNHLYSGAVVPINFDLKEIQKRGKLVALTGFSNTSYFIYKGNPMGYEYELLSMLAKHL